MVVVRIIETEGGGNGSEAVVLRVRREDGAADRRCESENRIL